MPVYDFQPANNLYWCKNFTGDFIILIKAADSFLIYVDGELRFSGSGDNIVTGQANKGICVQTIGNAQMVSVTITPYNTSSTIFSNPLFMLMIIAIFSILALILILILVKISYNIDSKRQKEVQVKAQ
ncbi:MAG: hypothetical protein JZD41_06530 [Thermoproteus sp.]|nr:hypothetical protein [Thermoproteus sp.]